MLVRCLAMMRGGGETRHLAWAHELSALGVDVDILAGRPLLFGGPRFPTDDVPNTAVTLLRSPYARDFVYRHQNQRGFGRLTMTALHADEEWFCRAAWRQIASRSERPDIVHAHALHQAARHRVADIPVVVNLPGAPHARYRDDLRLADALVADGWAAEHVPRILQLPVLRIAKGVDAESFRPDGPTLREALQLTDRRVVLTAARLVPIKRVSLLVEAFARLRGRVPGVHLLVVGDGPDGAGPRARAAALDAGDAVTFVGSVPHREMPAFYRTADVFALSSDFDNSPNAVLEAMASGLPIVATDVGGVREFIDEPMSGALVPPGDAEALARALHRYLPPSPEARTSSAYNRRKALAEFSWRASATQLLDVYRAVVSSRRRNERASA